MKQNREAVMGWIALSEGGYVNNPKDPGGATDRGITQRTFDAWNRNKGRPLRPVKGISKAEAEDILFEEYFRPIRFDDLYHGIDYAAADYAVNSGPARAAADLQRTINALLPASRAKLAVDGIIGAKTLVAAKDVNAMDLLEAYIDRRMDFLRVAKHPKTGAKLFTTFGKGWTTRVMGHRDGAQSDDIGVFDRAMLLMVSAGARPDIPAPVIAAPGKVVDPAPNDTGVPASTSAPAPQWLLIVAAAAAALIAGAVLF